MDHHFSTKFPFSMQLITNRRLNVRCFAYSNPRKKHFFPFKLHLISNEPKKKREHHKPAMIYSVILGAIAASISGVSGKMEIFAHRKSSNAGPLCIEVEGGDTKIQRIVREIALRTGLPLAFISVSSDGQRLDPEAEIANTGLSAESHIEYSANVHLTTDSIMYGSYQYGQPIMAPVQGMSLEFKIPYDTADVHEAVEQLVRDRVMTLITSTSGLNASTPIEIIYRAYGESLEPVMTNASRMVMLFCEKIRF